MTECIQLLEQGFGEMKSYVELRLSGIVNDCRRLRAHRLFAEADRVRQQALFEITK